MDFSYQITTVSGLVKARADDRIGHFAPQTGASALKGDKHFFSVLIKGVSIHNGLRLNVEIDSPLKEHITTYAVEHIPVRVPYYADRFDADYLDTKPGLYPDLLRPATAIYAMRALLSQLYVEVRTPTDLADPCGNFRSAQGRHPAHGKQNIKHGFRQCSQ